LLQKIIYKNEYVKILAFKKKACTMVLTIRENGVSIRSFKRFVEKEKRILIN